MNLALYSAESAGNKDLIKTVRRTINTELQKLVCFIILYRHNFHFCIIDYSKQNDHQIVIIILEHSNGIE